MEIPEKIVKYVLRLPLKKSLRVEKTLSGYIISSFIFKRTGAQIGEKRETATISAQ